MDPANVALLNDASVKVDLTEPEPVGNSSSQQPTRGSRFRVGAWLSDKESWGYEKMIVELELENGGLMGPLQKNGGFAKRLGETVGSFNSYGREGFTGHDLVELLRRFQLYYGHAEGESPRRPEVHFKEVSIRSLVLL